MYKIIISLPKKVALFSIRIYQKILSFDHSFWANPSSFRVCLHYPSCSEYTYQSIEKFGVIKGSVLGFFRILRCNPLNQNRIDEVPEKFEWSRVMKGSN